MEALPNPLPRIWISELRRTAAGRVMVGAALFPIWT